MFRTLLLFLLLSINISAQSSSYYSEIKPDSSSFITDLENLIRSNYVKIAYDDYKETIIPNYESIDNGDGTRKVKGVYSGYEYNYTPPFEWDVLSREHTWCYSWMPSYGDKTVDEYSDQHHLFPTHQDNANARRSNHPLGIVQTVSYQFLDGKLGTNSSGETVYEPRDEHKGDAARAILYMTVRYDGTDGNTWNFNWLNNVRLPQLEEASQSLELLLQWHKEDPPDKWEVERNDYIYSIQKNRNPFVDHPEYVLYINFNDLTKQSPVFATEPDNQPYDLSVSTDSNSIAVTWNDADAGSQAPSGYILMAYSYDNYFIPMDGVVYTDDSDLSDGKAVVNVDYAGADIFVFNGYDSTKSYYFRMYSFNGDSEQRNYNIDEPQSVSLISSIESANVASPYNFTALARVDNISLSWNKNAAGDNVMIAFNTANTFGTPENGTNYLPGDVLSGGGTVIYNGADISFEHTGLSPGTTYYYKAWSVNDSTNYSDGVETSATTDELTRTLLITEVADPADDYSARFVEITNIGGEDIDLSSGNYYLSRQANGSSTSWADIQLSGIIKARSSYVIAYSQSSFNSAYDFDPDLANGNITGNGDDGYFLYKGGDHSSGTLIDAYGVIDVDGSGEAWEYTDSRAYRKSTVTQANPTWTADEWVIESANVADMTPGNYPEVDASATFDTQGVEHDFVTSDHAAVKVKINTIEGSGTFSVKYYEGRGPKHATGITESNIGNFGWYFELDANITSINVDLKFYLSDLPDGSVTEGADQLKLYKRETFGTGDFSLVGTLTYNDNGTAGDQSDDWLEYDGITGFSEYAVAGNTGISPVELTSFTASVNGNSVTLNWQTATEVNNYGFQVERQKSKGESNWEKIGFVEGAGNSNSPKEYSFTDNPAASGKYSYRLKQIDLGGAYEYSNVVEVEVGVPSKFELSQNYPNPFNPTTTIKYSIPETAGVETQNLASLRVYNILGEEIATLVNKRQFPGNYVVRFNASNLPSGIYFYKLQYGNFVATKKMILMK